MIFRRMSDNELCSRAGKLYLLSQVQEYGYVCTANVPPQDGWPTFIFIFRNNRKNYQLFDMFRICKTFFL